MFKDLKIFRRNYGKNPTPNNENFPVDPTVSSSSQLDTDPSRPPFSTIQEPVQNVRLLLDQEAAFKRKNEKTPFKSNTRGPDPFFQFGTPEKSAAGQKKIEWIPKSEQPGLTCPESSEELLHQSQFQLPPPPPPPPVMWSHALNFGNGSGFFAATPRTMTTGGRASSVHSGTSSTQSTPTKSVSKPMFNGVSSSRTAMCGGTARGMNFLATSKGLPMFSAEDPSFWMDHNVQEMLFRVAGLLMVENCMSGYNNSCVFAYGQTGSGKTHTMLGEINDLETRPSTNRGTTPRIFEFLFARIKAEEESTRDEKVQYNCKCSFLEIYNEQITDLLNPSSSSNLLIREDPWKGVYVENLKEYEVENVNDILKLLIQAKSIWCRR